MTLNTAPPALTDAPLVDPTGGDPTGGDPTGAGAAGGSVRFVTGDAVSLDLPVAQLGSRMLARVIDLLVQVVLFFGLSMVLPVLLGLLDVAGVVEFDGTLYGALTIVLVVLVIVGYPVAMEALAGGRTVGKLAVGLRVVRDDGGPVRFRQAATRGLVSAAIEWPGMVAPPLTWLASIWTMAVSPQAKRLGDYAAGTLVIHDRTTVRRVRFPMLPPALAGWAATLDLAGLDDDLALAVRHFLSRAAELRKPARIRLAHQLAAEVAAVTRPAPPAGLPPEVYLAAVQAERHHRAVRRLVAVRGRTVALWPELVHPPRPAVPAAPPAPRSPTDVESSA